MYVNVNMYVYIFYTNTLFILFCCSHKHSLDAYHVYACMYVFYCFFVCVNTGMFFVFWLLFLFGFFVFCFVFILFSFFILFLLCFCVMLTMHVDMCACIIHMYMCLSVWLYVFKYICNMYVACMHVCT